MFEDTYFLNSHEALEVASQCNRTADGYRLQVCYYEGDKIESDLVNLVHLPIENLVDGLANGTYNIPTLINFDGLELSASVRYQIESHFNLSIQQAKILREQKNYVYAENFKNAKLDFSEPLRFYLMGHVQTRVMQHVAKNIADQLERMGFDVYFELFHGIEEQQCIKNLSLFNPHVFVSINHLNNQHLSQDIYNMIWFQDPMDILYSETEMQLRERDYVFSLVPMIDERLKVKNVPFERQGFCVNQALYHQNELIQREKKIVFIGSSYAATLKNTENEKEAVKKLQAMFLKGESFTQETINSLSNVYALSSHHVESRLIPYVVRDFALLELCKLDTQYSIEIYGWGWEKYAELAPYCKGSLEYGREIADVYSSATYAFAPHQQYTLQQRVFEASACGAIPIVYDCRDISKEDSYEEAFCYFKSLNDLEKIITADVKQKNFDTLLQNNTYESFIKKMLSKIKSNNVR